VTAAAAVEVFCDGACSGNPGPGGWAALLRAGARQKWLSGAEPSTTNNRMELMGAIAALEAITRSSRVVVTTDSQYVEKGAREWLPGWKRRGWRTASNAPVANRDLWERLDVQLARHQVDWKWCRGHSGHPENEECDLRARTALAELRKNGAAA
jgi:ribonuclease HI